MHEGHNNEMQRDDMTTNQTKWAQQDARGDAMQQQDMTQ
jgi:hypothetical protein